MSALSGRRLAMYIGLCAVWGSTWLVIKIGLRDLPPLWFGGDPHGARVRAPRAVRVRAQARRAHGRGAEARLLERPAADRRELRLRLSSPRSGSTRGSPRCFFATFPIFAGVFAHFMLPDEPVTTADGRRGAPRPRRGHGHRVARARRLALRRRDPADARRLGPWLCARRSWPPSRTCTTRDTSRTCRAIWNTWLQTLSGSTLLLVLAAVVRAAAPRCAGRRRRSARFSIFRFSAPRCPSPVSSGCCTACPCPSSGRSRSWTRSSRSCSATSSSRSRSRRAFSWEAP